MRTLTRGLLNAGVEGLFLDMYASSDRDGERLGLKTIYEIPEHLSSHADERFYIVEKYSTRSHTTGEGNMSDLTLPHAPGVVAGGD
jgi:hypothetical protein